MIGPLLAMAPRKATPLVAGQTTLFGAPPPALAPRRASASGSTGSTSARGSTPPPTQMEGPPTKQELVKDAVGTGIVAAAALPMKGIPTRQGLAEDAMGNDEGLADDEGEAAAAEVADDDEPLTDTHDGASSADSETEQMPSARSAVTALPPAHVNVFPALHDLTPFCHLCKVPVDPIGKGARSRRNVPHPEYLCPKCNTKCSQLSTLFGGWPIDEYRKLPEELKTKFWKESGSGVHALKEAVEKHIVLNSIKQQFSEFSGKFLPLAVWKKKGYNPAQIKNNAKRAWGDTLMCDVYQLKVLNTGNRQVSELARSEMIRLLGKNQQGSVLCGDSAG